MKRIRVRVKRNANWLWFWPVVGILIGWTYIGGRLDNGLVQADAQHVYLPAARAFIAQGWEFFASEASYRIVPLGYAWPALWGADPVLIRLANCVLWAGCVLSIWRSALLLGGAIAGVVSVALFILHPEIRQYFPTELTEPIFLFGLFAWLWSIAEWLIGGNRTLTLRALSAIFLTITLLSRPVLQLIAPASLILLIMASAYLSKRSTEASIESAKICRQMAIVLLCALILPALLVIKNGVLFGLWGLGTGSGTGLYLGTHPLFQGTEPAYLGFDYDVNDYVLRATGNPDHLSLMADRAASAAAVTALQKLSSAEAVEFFGRKLWWWIAHHPTNLAEHGSSLRKVRLFEWLVIGFCGLTMVWTALRLGWAALVARMPKPRIQQGGDRPRKIIVSHQITVVVVIAALGLAMLVQLLPILYNSRYSSTLLEPWIILLTGFAVSYFLQPYRLHVNFNNADWMLHFSGRHRNSEEPRAIFPGAFTVPVLIVLATAFHNGVKRYEIVKIDPAEVGPTKLRLSLKKNADVRAQGMQQNADSSWTMTESPAALILAISEAQVNQIKAEPLFNALWMTEIAITTERPAKCRVAEIAYTNPERSAPHFPSQIYLKADGIFHSYAIHGNSNLRPKKSGDFRLAFHCPVGTTIRLGDTQLLESIYTTLAPVALVK